MRSLWRWAWVVSAGLGLWACGSCHNPTEFRVATAGPLSGSESRTGKDVLNGVVLAVEETNAAGGVRGRRIVLVSADDGNDSTKAAEVALALCRKKPLFVIGHVDSGCSLKAAPIYQNHKVVMISPTSTSPKLTEQGLDHIFRVCGRDDMQGRAAAIWVIKHNMGQRVAVLHESSEYGGGLAREFVTNFEFLSGQKVAFDQELIGDDSKMNEAVQRCKDAGLDLIYFGGLHHQGAAFLRRLRQAGVNAAFMSGDGCFGPDFVAAAGPENAAGALATFYPDLSSLPGTGTRQFLAAYKARFGEPPGPFAIFGYKAAKVGLSAAANAVSPVSHRTLVDALRRLTFQTPYGLLRFCEKGDPADFRYVMWQVVDGKYEEMGV
ncbi:MAG: branched-chain amino acid ABC transporter substrate-binding protein [Acidobacteriota bacterium]